MSGAMRWRRGDAHGKPDAMRPALVSAAAIAVAACGHAPAQPQPVASEPTHPRPVASEPTHPGSAAPTSAPPPSAVPSCEGRSFRRYGTTCCTIVEEANFPGGTFLECRGPQVGASCHRQSDCDLACSCDDDAPLSPTQDSRSPPDGTANVTGHCSSRLQRGVSMCRLDASGLVTHIIID